MKRKPLDAITKAMDEIARQAADAYDRALFEPDPEQGSKGYCDDCLGDCDHQWFKVRDITKARGCRYCEQGDQGHLSTVTLEHDASMRGIAGILVQCPNCGLSHELFGEDHE